MNLRGKKGLEFIISVRQMNTGQKSKVRETGSERTNVFKELASVGSYKNQTETNKTEMKQNLPHSDLTL